MAHVGIDMVTLYIAHDKRVKISDLKILANAYGAPKKRANLRAGLKGWQFFFDLKLRYNLISTPSHIPCDPGYEEVIN